MVIFLISKDEMGSSEREKLLKKLGASGYKNRADNKANVSFNHLCTYELTK
jgi:hypothetical protein